MDRAAKKSPPKKPGGDKWKKLPKGWTDASRKKFWSSLTSAAPKHKVTECIKRMDKHMGGNAGAFCASLADRVIPGWRQEAAKDRKKKKARIAKVLTELEKEYDYKPGQDGRGLLRSRYDYNEAPAAPTKDKPHSMVPGKDQTSLDPEDPLHLERVAEQRDPLEPMDEDEHKSFDEDEEKKPHSQMPGTDNLTMEEDHRVGSSQWITRSEMEKLCPPCAVRMKSAGFTRVHVKVMRKMLARQGR